MSEIHPYSLNTDIAHARKVLVGLAWDCPLGLSAHECPLHSLRTGSLDERLKCVKGMTDEECIAVYKEHLHCMAQKIADQS